MSNAVGKVLGLINNLPRFVLDGVSAVLMGSVNGNCSVGGARYGIFSGTLVKADVAAGICCRDDFFLNQADFDMYSRIRELCYLTFGVKCKLIEIRHKTLGTHATQIR
jgi:rhamnosyltransferase